jgi:hypothetical protein
MAMLQCEDLAATMQKRWEYVDPFLQAWVRLISAMGLPDLARQTGETIATTLAGAPLSQSLEAETATLQRHAPSMYQASVASLKAHWCAQHWRRSLLHAFVDAHAHLIQKDTGMPNAEGFCIQFVVALVERTPSSTTAGVNDPDGNMSETAHAAAFWQSLGRIWHPPYAAISQPHRKSAWKETYDKMFATSTWEFMIFAMKRHVEWLLTTLMTALDTTDTEEVATLLRNHHLDDLRHLAPKTKLGKPSLTKTSPPENVLERGACHILLLCYASVLLQPPPPPLRTLPLSWSRYRGLCHLLWCLRNDRATVEATDEVILVQPAGLRFDGLFATTNPDLIETMRDLTWKLETLLHVPPNSLLHDSKSPFVLLLWFVFEVASKISTTHESREMESQSSLLAKKLLRRLLLSEEEEEQTLLATRANKVVDPRGQKRKRVQAKHAQAKRDSPHKTLILRLHAQGRILPESTSNGKPSAGARSNSDAEDDVEVEDNEDEISGAAMTDDEEQEGIDDDVYEECRVHDDEG